MTKTRLFFITDVHGSDRCFRKFVNAGKFYGADVLILGGDITGKMIVPIVRQPGGGYRCSFAGGERALGSDAEATEMVKVIKDSGYYPYFAEPSEVAELSAKPELVDSLFRKLMREDVERWMALAAERLKGTGIRCYVSPGNDDYFDIDPVLDSAEYVVNPEGKVVEIDDEHEMITLGYTNHTPWNSPREVDEDVLDGKIRAMSSQVKRMDRAVFNLHVPPIDTVIDQAPALDATLKPKIRAGSVETISAGSKAVRRRIEEDQPLMGIHGHIHESRGMVKIKRTLCFNPGSEYSSGLLRGLLCEIEGTKIKSHILTAG
ncbi:MAG: metallophosphoesterase [Thaumarchaeota archaeon]|nr:metallophosphoesterase [Nitrososphaerota archaeon]